MHYGPLLNKIHKYMHVHLSGGVAVEKLMLVEEAVKDWCFVRHFCHYLSSGSKYNFPAASVSVAYMWSLILPLPLNKKNVQNMSF